MIRMVFYDITGTKGRTKISNYLEAQGLERIQFSVFVGEIEPPRWQKVWKKLVELYEKECDAATDRIFSHVVDRDNFGKMLTLGLSPDKAWIMGEVSSLYFGSKEEDGK